MWVAPNQVCKLQQVHLMKLNTESVVRERNTAQNSSEMLIFSRQAESCNGCNFVESAPKNGCTMLPQKDKCSTSLAARNGIQKYIHRKKEGLQQFL